MNQAPVGFHCPNCIAEGKRTVRQIKNRTTPVTTTIIGLCVAAFLASFVFPDLWLDYGVAGVAIFEWGEYYRLVTAMFLHGGIVHIAFNMYVLFALGPTLERILGHGRYLVLYLLAAYMLYKGLIA